MATMTLEQAQALLAKVAERRKRSAAKRRERIAEAKRLVAQSKPRTK